MFCTLLPKLLKNRFQRNYIKCEFDLEYRDSFEFYAVFLKRKLGAQFYIF